jgi:hypothetical protein
MHWFAAPIPHRKKRRPPKQEELREFLQYQPTLCGKAASLAKSAFAIRTYTH